MAQSGDAPALPALPTLVERLTAFLRGQPHRAPGILVPDAPHDITHVLEHLGHHVTVLTLVARADDNILAKERQIIFRYCVQRASKIGPSLSKGEKHALLQYLDNFYPPLALLENALERLKFDSKADLEGLLEAAHDVIAADYIFRVDEVSFLISLRHDLAAL